MSLVSPAALSQLSRLLLRGPSLLAATRDASFTPELVRCNAAEVRDDGSLLIAIPLPEGARTIENLEATGVIAVTAGRPTTYETLQVKGRGATKADWPSAAAVAAAHRAAMIEEVVAVGIQRELSGTFWSLRFVVYSFPIEEIFDQKPGPGAGLRVGS